LIVFFFLLCFGFGLNCCFTEVYGDGGFFYGVIGFFFFFSELLLFSELEANSRDGPEVSWNNKDPCSPIVYDRVKSKRDFGSLY
jgi:hypothetical protein